MQIIFGWFHVLRIALYIEAIPPKSVSGIPGVIPRGPMCRTVWDLRRTSADSKGSRTARLADVTNCSHDVNNSNDPMELKEDSPEMFPAPPCASYNSSFHITISKG
jgi:hypothetical protein